MGCCVGMRQNALINENLVVDIEQNEKNDITTSSNELLKEKDKNSKKSDSFIVTIDNEKEYHVIDQLEINKYAKALF